MPPLQDLRTILLPYHNLLYLLLLTSVGYAIALQIWSTYWPESFDDLTWLTVVIGVGYVLLFQAAMLPLEYWLLALASFAVACPPIIARSVILVAVKRRATNRHLEDLADD